MDMNDEFPMIALDSPEQEPDKLRLGGEKLVEKMGHLDDKVFENRSLGGVLRGLTAI